MKDDLISRQAAIETVRKAKSKGEAHRMLIQMQPAQPGWIPVTERLPEIKQRVLVQQKDGFMDVRKCIDGGHLAWFYSDIVAWMPLPEPWRGEQP